MVLPPALERATRGRKSPDDTPERMRLAPEAPAGDRAGMVCRSPSLALATVALVCAGLASAALVGAPPGAAGSSARELRPDLVQRTPSNVGVRASGRRFALGFDSAVENHGDGPLRVSGDRLGAQPDLRAHQLVRRADGTRALVEGVGLLRTHARAATITGTCCGSIATSCAAPPTTRSSVPTARRASASVTATTPGRTPPPSRGAP
jgi:hypothetical protein